MTENETRAIDLVFVRLRYPATMCERELMSLERLVYGSGLGDLATPLIIGRLFHRGFIRLTGRGWQPTDRGIVALDTALDDAFYADCMTDPAFIAQVKDDNDRVARGETVRF